MASGSNSSFGSHNPFRRKSSAAETSSPATSWIDTETPASRSAITATTTPSDFARALSSLPSSTTTSNARPPPNVTFQKKKPVKKVRVQSPPPSSPESTGAEHTYPKYPLPPRDEDDESSEDDRHAGFVNGEREDPFANEAPPLPEDPLAGSGMSWERFADVSIGHSPQAQPWTGRGPPPNPFQKTLEDMEQGAREGGQEHGAGAGKAGMDVEAFKRLLLTGQGPASSQDGGSITESSSISRQSIFDAVQETPRTSHEISEDDEKRGLLSTPSVKRSGSRRKPPPPPPATRHGKLIQLELRDKGREARASLEGRTVSGFAAMANSPDSSSGSPTDVNKPLPAPPERAEDGFKNNVFEKEAAGKIPEVDLDPEADVVPSPRPPTPPNASHSSDPVPSPSSTSRKPAPPPRRSGHARGDSKSSPMEFQEEATTPSRSSMDSQRSRSSSIRNLSISAPTPPPPRRGVGGGGGHRQSPSVSSPSQSSPSFPLAPVSPAGDDMKLSPPPPPPQRSTSLRKSSNPSSARPLAKGPALGGPPPPPPRPRARGGSKGSIDGGLARGDSVRRVSGEGSHVATVAEEENGEPERVDGVDTAASDEAVRAMLADLEALQREVDAAARMAAGGGG